MANVNIGKVALTPAGDYNSTSTYEKLDIVKDQGSSFIAKKAVPVGTTTGNDEYWQMVASIGATGPTGPEGPIGHTIEWGEIEGNIEDQEDLYTSLSTLNNTKEDLIIKSASGSIVNISDGAEAPISGLSVDIKPVQNLHGYDAPWPIGGGKNLLSPTASFTETQNGIIFTGDGNGNYTIKGTSTATAFVNIPLSKPLVYPDKDVYLHERNNTATNKVAVVLLDENADVQHINKTTLTVNAVSDAKNNYGKTSGYIRLYVNGSDTVVDMTLSPMVLDTNTTDKFYPYSNICPISGWDEAVVMRTGKNILDQSKCIAKKYINASGGVSNSDNWCASDYTPIKGGQTYTFSGYTAAGWSAYHAFYDSNKTFISAEYAINHSTFTAPNNATYVRLSIYTETPTVAQLELGSTATAYEAPQIQTVTIDLDGTRYGGELNVLTGEMTVTYGYKQALSSWTWNYSSITKRFYTTISDAKADEGTAQFLGICNMFKSGNMNTQDGISYVNASTNGVAFHYEVFSVVSDWENFLDNNDVYFTYPLATPFTVQLTPAQIQILLDENYIWANTGDISVNYWKKSSQDLIDGVQELIDYKITESQRATRSIIGGIERTNIATKNYVVGEYVIVGDDLLKITTNVASGNSLTIGTNCVKTTVAEALIALASA